jgi:hypothetical protein
MIYTVGCSFTAGDELTNSNHAWPHLLAKDLQTTVINDAISGGTNYRSVYHTIKNLDHDHDLYIIAWTTTARYTFYKSDNNFEINFNPLLTNSLYGHEKFYSDWGRTLYQHWHNDLWATKIWMQQIIQLQSILEKHKKKYIMLNTMPNNLSDWLVSQDCFIDSVKSLINFEVMSDEQILREHQEIQNYTNLIDTDKFYQWNKFSIIDLTKIFPVGPNGHLLESGHQHLSNLLLEYINV